MITFYLFTFGSCEAVVSLVGDQLNCYRSILKNCQKRAPSNLEVFLKYLSERRFMPALQEAKRMASENPCALPFVVSLYYINGYLFEGYAASQDVRILTDWDKGYCKKVKEFCEKFLINKAKKDPSVNWFIITVLNDLGVLETSCEEIEKFARKYPESPEFANLAALVNLQLLRKSGRTEGVNIIEKARKWAKKAVELDPHNPVFWTNLISTYTAAEDYEKAEELLLRALDRVSYVNIMLSYLVYQFFFEPVFEQYFGRIKGGPHSYIFSMPDPSWFEKIDSKVLKRLLSHPVDAAFVAHQLEINGHPAKALKLLEEVERYHGSKNYAHFGESYYRSRYYITTLYSLSKISDKSAGEILKIYNDMLNDFIENRIGMFAVLDSIDVLLRLLQSEKNVGQVEKLLFKTEEALCSKFADIENWQIFYKLKTFEVYTCLHVLDHNYATAATYGEFLYGFAPSFLQNNGYYIVSLIKIGQQQKAERILNDVIGSGINEKEKEEIVSLIKKHCPKFYRKWKAVSGQE